MRNIFLRLTRLDEDPAAGIERRDTRRRVALDELVPAGSERRQTIELINRLADARLVITGVDPVSGQEEVEVSHEGAHPLLEAPAELAGGGPFGAAPR